MGDKAIKFFKSHNENKKTTIILFIKGNKNVNFLCCVSLSCKGANNFGGQERSVPDME